MQHCVLRVCSSDTLDAPLRAVGVQRGMRWSRGLSDRHRPIHRSRGRSPELGLCRGTDGPGVALPFAGGVAWDESRLPGLGFPTRPTGC